MRIKVPVTKMIACPSVLRAASERNYAPIEAGSCVHRDEDSFIRRTCHNWIRTLIHIRYSLLMILKIWH